MDLKEVAKRLRGRHPSTLFHFTSKKGLLGILGNNFKVSYAREELSGANSTRRLGVPMVSFCDLRLSELYEHMQLYGSYGIGMSKEWAYENQLNTVYYISSRSLYLDSYFQSLEKLFERVQRSSSVDEFRALAPAYERVIQMMQFMKNYEGPNAKLDLPAYRYADEREWRYVPSGLGVTQAIVPIQAIASAQLKAKLNEAVADIVLGFEPKDIRYIIVEREDERDEIIDRIFDVKVDKYGDAEARRLASRVLTAEQIKFDV